MSLLLDWTSWKCQRCGFIAPQGVSQAEAYDVVCSHIEGHNKAMTAPPSPIPLAERLREMAVGMDKEGRCFDVEWGDGNGEDNGFYQVARAMVEAAAALTDLTARAERAEQAQCIMVTQPNGEPVPAPCAISGCHFDAFVEHKLRADQAEAALAGLREEKTRPEVVIAEELAT